MTIYPSSVVQTACSHSIEVRNYFLAQETLRKYIESPLLAGYRFPLKLYERRLTRKLTLRIGK